MTKHRCPHCGCTFREPSQHHECAAMQEHADLERAEQSYRHNADNAEKARVHRNRLILAAVAAGMPQAEIARALGMTTARVSQIVNGPLK